MTRLEKGFQELSTYVVTMLSLAPLSDLTEIFMNIANVHEVVLLHSKLSWRFNTT